MSTEPGSTSNTSGTPGAAETTAATRVQERPRQEHAAPAKPKRSMNVDPGRAARGLLGLVAAAVRILTLLFAVILVAYVVFVFFQANPANAWAQFVSDWAHGLNLGLDGLFAPGDPKVAVLVNYGLAAVIWLAVGMVVSKILRRF